MNPALLRLAAEILPGLIAAGRRPPIRWPLLALGGIFALIAVVFLAIASDLALEERMSPPAAAAVVGGGLLLIALILVWAALYRHRRAPRTDALPIAALTEYATKLFGDVEGKIQTSPKTFALTAFAVGCVFGSSPDLQRLLRKLIR